MPRQKTLALALALIVCLSSLPAAAQVQTGEVFGNVVDQQGGALPGVAVTLAGPSLIQPQSVTSSPTGAYRFPGVPIGVYTVRFEVTGFQRLVREGIRIETGFNAEINATLVLSAQEETVTVSGQSPVVDTRATSLGANFTREALESIPSARDPWVILEQTPGMVMTRQNVGGTTSGQQPGFLARGSATNQMWNLDGSTITDMPDNTSSMLLRFRLVRGNPNPDRRQRRVPGRRRGRDQPGHQERRQCLQGDLAAVRHRQGAAGRQRRCRTSGPGRGCGQSAEEHHRLRARGRRPHLEEQGVVLGQLQQGEHQGRRDRLPHAWRHRPQRSRQPRDGPHGAGERQRQGAIPVGEGGTSPPSSMSSATRSGTRAALVR